MALHHIRLKLDEAQAYVRRYHRHSDPLKRHKFSIGAMPYPLDIHMRVGAKMGIPVAYGSGAPFLYGVLTVDTPSSHEWSRYRDYAEIRRIVTTTDTPNVSSFLIGKAKQACLAMGYRRLITYTRINEPGTSLRASGFDIFSMKGTLLTWDCFLGEKPKTTHRKFTDDTLRRLRPIVEMRAE